ncbi:hypothetical protein E2C01_065078 [Portunus trituberculatus]|uniref:Uncharacterized protein n=1 Tax=Portunus trituberculatus TaxID=210409 RepID=A0A5B7HQ44_PORTR|nr:hypothetical protein [Portunus trituberculatus]
MGVILRSTYSYISTLLLALNRVPSAATSQLAANLSANATNHGQPWATSKINPGGVKNFSRASHKYFSASKKKRFEQLRTLLLTRITTLEVKVKDLIKSLEFTQSEVCELQTENKTLQKSDHEKRTLINDYKARIQELEQRSNYQEDYNHSLNLRFCGLHELRSGETWEETTTLVQKTILDKLQLSSMNLEHVHHVGPLNPLHPRTIVAQFEKFADRETVLRNGRKMKRSGIFINEDLCAASQAIQSSQLPQLKQTRKDGKIASLKYTKLITKDCHVEQTNTTTTMMYYCFNYCFNKSCEN